jgi:uncharacterized protein
MALEMRAACERCGRALAAGDEAFICSFECTFCAGCTQEMEGVCPNCGGELARRPTRLAPDPESAAALSLKRQQVVERVAAAQARRRDLRAQTDRIFIFLAALVALVATQVDDVDGDLDRLLLGLGVCLGAAPLVLIYRAKTPWRPVDPFQIETSSLRKAELTVIEQNQTLFKALEREIRRARQYLVAAEIASAIAAFYLIGLSLAALGGESPRPGSWRAIATYLMIVLSVVALAATVVRVERRSD